MLCSIFLLYDAIQQNIKVQYAFYTILKARKASEFKKNRNGFIIEEIKNFRTSCYIYFAII